MRKRHKLGEEDDGRDTEEKLKRRAIEKGRKPRKREKNTSRKEKRTEGDTAGISRSKSYRTHFNTNVCLYVYQYGQKMGCHSITDTHILQKRTHT